MFKVFLFILYLLLLSRIEITVPGKPPSKWRQFSPLPALCHSQTKNDGKTLTTERLLAQCICVAIEQFGAKGKHLFNEGFMMQNY